MEHKPLHSRVKSVDLAQADPQRCDVSRSTKLLYFIGVDWFFYSHFLDRAIAAKDAGYDVVVLTKVTREDSRLAHHNIKLLNIDFSRRSLNPMVFMRSLREVIRVFRSEKPDIVHLVALKPILMGSLAAKFVKNVNIVNAVVGLGYAFSSRTRSARVARFVLSSLFKWVFKTPGAKTVFENVDDRDYFLRNRWVCSQTAVLIRGAGVDTERFRPGIQPIDEVPGGMTSDETTDKANSFQPQEDGVLDTLSGSGATERPIVLLLSRMLWDKGVGEFVQAAEHLQRLRGDGYARFVLVGDTDAENRGAIEAEQLLKWQSAGLIQWWGFRADVENVLSLATISCLPSYREGLPKSLLESMAVGLPCVATDVPGCREAVVHGVNGLLVPARDSRALASAIDQLLQAPQLRKQYGEASRQMTLDYFSKDIVNRQTLELYAELGANRVHRKI
jgi:glycosyltransferase involved in cell wall biosynthesis